MSINHAQRWGQFIASTTFADLPAGVVDRMKRSLLDMLGCAIIGSRFPSSEIVGRYAARTGAGGEATVIPSGHRASAFDAALAVGSSVHAPELAESFTRATMHCGNAVPPAVLAAVERAGGSGRDLLLGMALGYEVAIRTGLALRAEPPGAGFTAKDENRATGPLGPNHIGHPVATFGLYGATAGAASVLRLDPVRCAQALVLCTSLTPVIGRASAFWEGASAKDVFQGLTNAVGVMSADLAQLGLTGGDDITTHLRSLVADVELDWLDWALGEEWLITSGGLHFKLHMTSGMTQPAAEALLTIMSKGRIRPEEVEHIDAYVPERGSRQSAVAHPPSPTAATISIPYVLSAIITCYDEVLADPYFTTLYTQEKFDDVRRRDLADRIVAHGVEEFDLGFERSWPMRFEARVECRLRSGEVRTETVDIWDRSANLADEDVQRKFRDVAGRVLPAAQVERVIALVSDCDRLDTVDSLVAAACLPSQAGCRDD
jgi:2-methylcitrate dehydratase PrpD